MAPLAVTGGRLKGTRTGVVLILEITMLISQSL
jgi:hypothetical protein